MSIKFKASLAATAGVLLIFAILTGMETSRVRSDMRVAIGSQLLTLIARIADELDDKIRLTHRVLIATAQAITPEMMKDPSALEDSLQGQLGIRAVFDDLLVFGIDGKVLIDLPKLDRAGLDVHDREYFRQTVETRAPVISEPYMGRGRKEPTIMMTAPILDRDGKVVGVLGGALHPLAENFLGKLIESHVGKTGFFALFSRSRLIIVSRIQSRIMTEGPAPGASPMFDHAVAGMTGWEESTNSRGLRAVFSYKPLTAAPWTLVAGLPVEEAYAPIALIQSRVIGKAVLLALLVAPLVWLGASYLLAPIGALRDAIRRIGSDPSGGASVQMPRRDELGDLAENFNRMIEQLREHARAIADNEVRFRKIFDAGPTAKVIVNAQGRVVLASEAVHDVLGYPPDEILGVPLEQLAPGCFFAARAISSEDDGPYAADKAAPAPTRELTVLRKDGREVRVELCLTALETAHGPVTLASIADITERKRAEEARAKLAAIVESSQDAILSRSLDRTIESWNAAAEQLLGYTAQEAIGRHIRMIIPPEHVGEFIETSDLLNRGEFMPPFETVRMAKDGRRIEVLASASAVLDAAGRPSSVAVIYRDITERKRAESELARLNAELEGRVAARTRELELAIKELDAFSYSVSHDLRTPLRAISGFAQIVLEENEGILDDATTRHLSRISGGAARMGELIDDMLLLSRITRQEMRLEEFSLTALAREVVKTLADTLPASEVEVDIKPDMRCTADRSLIRIVLENLIGNAWKFTGKTSNPRIEIGCEEGVGQAVYYVRDNGAGFDMRYVGKLFEPFQRLHSAAEFDGTGIGLSIVQRVILRHHGRVWAEGKVRGGAAFHFTLGTKAPENRSGAEAAHARSS